MFHGWKQVIFLKVLSLLRYNSLLKWHDRISPCIILIIRFDNLFGWLLVGTRHHCLIVSCLIPLNHRLHHLKWRMTQLQRLQSMLPRRTKVEGLARLSKASNVLILESLSFFERFWIKIDLNSLNMTFVLQMFTTRLIQTTVKIHKRRRMLKLTLSHICTFLLSLLQKIIDNLLLPTIGSATLLKRRFQHRVIIGPQLLARFSLILKVARALRMWRVDDPQILFWPFCFLICLNDLGLNRFLVWIIEIAHLKNRFWVLLLGLRIVSGAQRELCTEVDSLMGRR